MNTGEVFEPSEILKLELGDRVYTEKQRTFLRKQKERYEDQTAFVWLNFQYGTNFELPVDPAVAVRFLYFGTACGSTGIIQKNKLMQANLDLNKNQQTAFFKQTLQSGLLRKDASVFYVNPDIISWGEYTADSDHIRIFSGYYRMLCEATSSQAELKRIYYILQMIPYLNRQTNILSHNQTEQEFEHIVYMPFNEFCKKINYSEAHCARLKGQLSAFRVNGELAVGFFDDITELTPNGKNVILNPKLCFGGDRTVSRYKELCALFEIEKKLYEACSADSTQAK